MHVTKFPVAATGTLVLTLLVVFAPSLFFGRVISPLDVLYNTPPYRATHRPVEVTNPDLTPAATVSLSLMEAARRDGVSIALWNPYRAAGGPGALSWTDGLLSPMVLPFLPWADPAHLPNAIVLAKLLLAFAGMWLFLKQRGLGDVAASMGGAAFALAGPLAANWLWTSSATAAALPLVLWAVEGTLASAHPWRWAAPDVLIWTTFLAGGAAGPTVMGIGVVLAWTFFRFAPVGREHPRRSRPAAVLAVAPLLAAAILAPSLGLFAASPRARTSPGRAAVSSWGVGAIRLLWNPFIYGDPRQGTFAPPRQMGPVPFHDTVLDVGLVTLLLALAGAATRRRETFFWAAILGAGVIVIVVRPAGRLFGRIPGCRGSPIPSLAPVIALAAAVLAAWGLAALMQLVRAGTLRKAAGLVIVAVVLEQGMFAGHLMAYLHPAQAGWPTTRGLEFLEAQSRRAPARVAPLGDTLTPDTAEAYGLEDLRSRYGSTPAYRKLLSMIDPQVDIEPAQGLRLNAATVDLQHPYLRALGARWVLEDPDYGLVEFSLGQNTVEVEPRNRLLGPLSDGSVVTQDFLLPRGCSRLALNGDTRVGTVEGVLRVTLTDEMTGRRQASWDVDASKLVSDGFVWLSLPPGLDPADRFQLTIVSHVRKGIVRLRRTSNPHALDGELLFDGRRLHGDLGLSFDVSGYVPVYRGRDLRIWEDRRAAPRFWIVRHTVPGGIERLLAARPPLDLGRVAIVAPEEAKGLRGAARRAGRGREWLRLKAWGPAVYELTSRLTAPALLVSSVPRRPRLWRASIDGRPTRLITVNGLFLGMPLPAGTHRIRLIAVLSPWLWAVSGFAMMVVLGLGAGAVRPRKGRRR